MNFSNPDKIDFLGTSRAVYRAIELVNQATRADGRTYHVMTPEQRKSPAGIALKAKLVAVSKIVNDLYNAEYALRSLSADNLPDSAYFKPTGMQPLSVDDAIEIWCHSGAAVN